MNYVTILKGIVNPKLAFSLMASRGMLNWLRDEEYLRILYRLRTGKKLDLRKPTSFNEKLQWLKLYDRKPMYTALVDKYEVREFVQSILGADCLIPLVGGPWLKPEEINFDQLPDQFVLKCTHDSGGIVICRDKSQFNRKKACERMKHSLGQNFYWLGREWPYKDVKPRIIAEAYMNDDNEVQGLTDYKFFCFDGEPKFLYVSQGLENHSTANISFYDLDGKPLPFHRKDYEPINRQLILPSNYALMIDAAKRISREVGNPFVRVDLYSIQGKMYFSEITFSPCSGFIPFEPESWDLLLGAYINLPVV